MWGGQWWSLPLKYKGDAGIIIKFFMDKVFHLFMTVIIKFSPFHDCVNGIGHHKVHTMLGLFNAYQISEIMR